MLQLCLPFFQWTYETLSPCLAQDYHCYHRRNQIFTAYHLAKVSRRPTHRVIVVEAADDIFANNSGTNTNTTVYYPKMSPKMTLSPWGDTHTVDGKNRG